MSMVPRVLFGKAFAYSRSFYLFKRICRYTDLVSTAKNNELELSDNCVERLKLLNIGERFLRVMIEGGGCSGFQYQFEIDDIVGDSDRVFERNGVRVVVDEESLAFINGSVIDYHEELIKSGFVVANNPQAEQGCSCGASFTVKL